MFRDTVIELRQHLKESQGNSDFERGYQMGLGYALEVLKDQCHSFGLREDLGWMEPDVTTWLRKD